jgi:hypothetical protein
MATSGAPGPEDPEDTAGAGIDTAVPHSARIWNYWLGGKDNYAVDREAGDQYVKIYGVMGHIPDDDEAQSIAQRLLAGLPSGSFLALYDSLDISEALNEAQQGYDDTGAVPYKLRRADQIERFFGGLEFVTPGLVRCPEWRPEAGQAGGARMGLRWPGSRASPNQPGDPGPAHPGAPGSRSVALRREGLR